MHYEVDINLGRKGKAPVWRPMEEQDGSVCRFAGPEDAMQAVREDGRGADIRAVMVDGNDRRHVAMAG